MKSLEQKIIVRCKNCGWRIFDKVTITPVVIVTLSKTVAGVFLTR